jgi:hypothetical protein
VQGGQLRWTPGAPAIGAPEVTVPTNNAPNNDAPAYGAPPTRPMSIYAPGVAVPDDVPDDAVLPPGRGAPQRLQGAYNAPNYAPPQQQQQLPALGPMRGPMTTGAMQPATVTPAATLSCPIVSALDKWVTEGVQPAAMRWFGSQVTEIKQISAYSCRGMNGAGGHGISEHAFGNALDIAGFTLADGRKVIIKNAWRNGTPEEQGFLHDVQLYACDTFSTVLAPGYNAAHYDHIHVDLMRRNSGRRPCRPEAIPGEVVAAKARAVYAARRGTTYTGSIGGRQSAGVKPGQAPAAVPGADGLDEDDDAVTGSIAGKPVKPINRMAAGDDGEFDDDEVTGSIPAPASAKTLGWPRLAPAVPRIDNNHNR